MSEALILLAHGSREPEWAHPLQMLRELIRRQRPAGTVELAYLDLMPPALADTVGQLAAQGTRNIRVLPVFLGQGNHVRNDLPRLAESVRARHPEVTLTLLPALGEQPEILEALARAIVRALD